KYNGGLLPWGLIGTSDFQFISFPSPSSNKANFWIVGFSNKVAKGKCLPVSFSIARIILTANNEYPPISKKLSCILIPSWPNVSDQIRRISRSLSVEGATTCAATLSPEKSTGGSDFRSIFPLLVSGNLLTATIS